MIDFYSFDFCVHYAEGPQEQRAATSLSGCVCFVLFLRPSHTVGMEVWIPEGRLRSLGRSMFHAFYAFLFEIILIFRTSSARKLTENLSGFSGVFGYHEVCVVCMCVFVCIVQCMSCSPAHSSLALSSLTGPVKKCGAHSSHSSCPPTLFIFRVGRSPRDISLIFLSGF